VCVFVKLAKINSYCTHLRTILCYIKNCTFTKYNILSTVDIYVTYFCENIYVLPSFHIIHYNIHNTTYTYFNSKI